MGRWLLDSKTEWSLRCLLAKATWWRKCNYNYNYSIACTVASWNLPKIAEVCASIFMRSNIFRYVNSGKKDTQGIMWFYWGRSTRSLKSTQMKIQPVHKRSYTWHVLTHCFYICKLRKNVVFFTLCKYILSNSMFVPYTAEYTWGSDVVLAPMWYCWRFSSSSAPCSELTAEDSVLMLFVKCFCNL